MIATDGEVSQVAGPMKLSVPGWKKFWADKGFPKEMRYPGIDAFPDSLVKKIFHVGPWFMVVVNYGTLGFECVKGVEPILGYSDKQMLDGNVEFLVDLLHPDDREKVLGLAVHYYQFLDQQPVERRLDFKVSLNLRLRTAQGDYVRLLEQVIGLHMDAQGRVTHALKYFTSLAHLNYSNEVVLSILDDKADGTQSFYTFDLEEKKSGLANNGMAATFSEREREILALIACGKTTKEISAQLAISTNTVNKHRENMLRKTGCRNLSEVVSFAYCHDYL